MPAGFESVFMLLINGFVSHLTRLLFKLHHVIYVIFYSSHACSKVAKLGYFLSLGLLAIVYMI